MKGPRSRASVELRLVLPSTLEAVEEFCRDFHQWRAEACSGVNRFSAELLLREALTNSVVHGNGGDRNKNVFCVVRGGDRRLLIAIRDEGNGFDWRSASTRDLDIEKSHGRGLQIYKRYANSVRFNREGNSVVLIKKI